MSARQLLLNAIRERAILREENQRLIGPKGNRNVWLLDMRRIFMDGQLLNAFAEYFCDAFSRRFPYQVGGMEVGAIPLVAAVLMKSMERGCPVNGFIVRKERKTYGTGSLVEGTISDAPIIIVDDILNSGASLEKVRVILEQQGRNIATVFVLVDYQSAKSQAWRGKHRIDVHAPFGLADFGLTTEKPEQRPLRTVFQNVWRFAAPDPNFFHCVPKSFPATRGTRVYFGSDCGVFWCLNALDGSVIWTFKVRSKGHKNLWSAPALHGGRVFFGSYNGNLYCLDGETGAEIWRFEGADWIGSSPALAPGLNLLFIGLEFAAKGRQGSIIALDLDTGGRKWEHRTRRYTHASPAVWLERELVACGSNDDELLLFDCTSGNVRWRFRTQGGGAKGSIRHAPAFDFKRGHLITGSANGCIYVVDVETGEELWSVPTDNTIYTVPLVVNDLAYIGSTDKHLYVLDLEQRRVLKKIYTGSKVFGPPRLLDGKVYFGSNNGIVYELDPPTGHLTGMHQLPDAVTNALCYNADTRMFYALTYVNQLFAFRRLG